jgi:hypothetical protein
MKLNDADSVCLKSIERTIFQSGNELRVRFRVATSCAFVSEWQRAACSVEVCCFYFSITFAEKLKIEKRFSRREGATTTFHVKLVLQMPIHLPVIDIIAMTIALN